MSIEIANETFEGPVLLLAGVPTTSGVYVVLTKDSDGAYVPLDVGQGGNLRERLTGHPREGCWRRHMQTGIQYAFFRTMDWTKEERLAWEQLVRDEMNPPCGDV